MGLFQAPGLRDNQGRDQGVVRSMRWKPAKIMFDKCWLGGKGGELRTDARFCSMAVQKQLGQVLNSCMGSLKNL